MSPAKWRQIGLGLNDIESVYWEDLPENDRAITAIHCVIFQLAKAARCVHIFKYVDQQMKMTRRLTSVDVMRDSKWSTGLDAQVIHSSVGIHSRKMTLCIHVWKRKSVSYQRLLFRWHYANKFEIRNYRFIRSYIPKYSQQRTCTRVALTGDKSYRWFRHSVVYSNINIPTKYLDLFSKSTFSTCFGILCFSIQQINETQY